MKKEYISPTASVICIKTGQLMEIASKLPSSNPGQSVSVGLTEKEYDGEGASRRSSVWGDEDNDF